LKCRDLIRELSDYLDGGVDAATLGHIEHHLAACEDCKLIVNQTKMAIELFCDSQPVELPTEVRARLHEALRQKMQESLR